MSELYDFVKQNGSDPSCYERAITMITRKKRFLRTVYFQLTPVCNLSCNMCFAKLSLSEVAQKGKRVLGYDDWKFYIDSISQMGVVDLILTGGECTIHPDFEKIYTYAYNKGLSISVMTNGSCITNNQIDLWKSMPPVTVSITIYGNSPETYEKLCGNGRAFDNTLRNIDFLLEAGINVKPKYTAVRENIQDLEATYLFFKNKGMTLLHGAVLTQFGNCSSDVIENENAYVQYSDVLAKLFPRETNEVTNEKEIWKARHQYLKDNVIIDRGLECSAGRNCCHINWQGLMTPCVAFDAFSEDPRIIGFRKCWELLVDWADHVPALTECQKCLYQSKCHLCIALHYNDLKVFGKPSPRLCWKYNHPEEAAVIEKMLIHEGACKPDE